MSDVLSAVVAAARRAAEDRAGSCLAREVEAEAVTRHPSAGAFRSALASRGFRVIAECKRRSPSRGVLRRDYEPAAIARGYEAAGAAAISVLTEPTFFDGSLDHLRRVRASVAVPLLRKDFVVTDFQVLEARAAGADAVLLIVAALADDALAALLRRAADTGLAALVEVHDEEELRRAIGAGAEIIGVNSRNLRTLDVSMEVFDRLAPLLKGGTIAVAESGIRSGSDLSRLAAKGYGAFLVGERFMTMPEPGQALAELLADATSGAA